MFTSSTHHEHYQGKSVYDYEKFAIVYRDSTANGKDVLLTNQRPIHRMDALTQQ